MAMTQAEIDKVKAGFDSVKSDMARRATLQGGYVPATLLGSGTADATSVLHGDRVWRPPSGGGGGATLSDVAFDTSARKTNGILQVGALLDSGHAYGVRANADANRFKWASGALVHDRPTTNASAAYAGTQLPGRVGRAWVDFQFTDSNSEDVVLIVSGGSRPFTTPITVSSGIVGDGFSDSATHLTIAPGGWSYGILTNDPWAIDELANGAFSPALEAGVTHTFRVDFDGATVTMTTPRGVEIVRTDARIGTAAYRGPYAAVELYAGTGSAKTASKIMSWGATQEAPISARAFTPAQPPDARAMWYAPDPQVDVAVPAGSTDIHTDFGLPVVVPSTGRLLITASVYLEQTSGSYLMGLNLGTGTGDGLQRVVEGAYKGVATARWLWDLQMPGNADTIRPEHFNTAGAGAATVKFGSSSGYYGHLSAVSVL